MLNVKKGTILRLKKTLYGLKQASNEFNKKFLFTGSLTIFFNCKLYAYSTVTVGL